MSKIRNVQGRKFTLALSFFLVALILTSLVGVYFYKYNAGNVFASSGELQLANENLGAGEYSVAYADYSSIDALPKKYSYGTIYYTEETEVNLLKGKYGWIDAHIGVSTYYTQNDQEVTKENLPTVNLGQTPVRLCSKNDNGNFSVLRSNPGNHAIVPIVFANEEAIIQVTKCAVDEDGNLCDVVIKINNVVPWDQEGFLYLGIAAEDIYNNQANPDENDTSKLCELKPNNLVTFILYGTTACGDFSMTYYKSGTYNSSTQSGQYANVNATTGMFSDIDVYCRESATINPAVADRVILDGDEGIVPRNGNNVIYFAKNINPTLSMKDNGISENKQIDISMNQYNESTLTGNISEHNSLWYRTSAFVTTSDLPNSTYKFTYGGQNCGIVYFFGSPFPFNTDEPIKAVDKTEVFEEEEFTYKVTQYVPNNGIALASYNAIYRNIPTNSQYSKVEIVDELNSNLSVLGNGTERITVTDEAGADVTNYFTITLNGNTVKAEAKADVMATKEFYSRAYTINIPVKAKSGSGLTAAFNDKNAKVIPNYATRTTNVDPATNTNTVNVTLKYIITTRVTNGTITPETTYTIHDNGIVEITPFTGYKITSITVDGQPYTITNATGKETIVFSDVRANHEVVAVCDKITNNIIVQKTWVDNNNAEGKRPASVIAVISNNVNNEIREVTLSAANNWRAEVEGMEQYDATTGTAITYTVSEKETTAGDLNGYKNAVVTLSNGVYTISNTIKEQEPPAPEKATVVIQKMWEDNDNAAGKRPASVTAVISNSSNNSEREVTLSAANEWKVQVNDLPKTDSTGKTIEYTVSEKITDTEILKYYKADKITKQKIESNGATISMFVITNTYKTQDAKVIVKFVEKKSGNELAERTALTGKVGETYTTTAKEIKNYKRTADVPANATGTYTATDIEVVYYYEKLPATINARYIDVKTGKDIIVNNKDYTETIMGYVGEKYTTVKKDIPYYKFVTVTSNATGTLAEKNEDVKYYYEKEEFNMAVDKVISKVTVNGTEQTISNNKLDKKEVVSQNISSTNIQVTYTVTVKNTGDIKGKATVADVIPDGLRLVGYSQGWTARQDGNLETTQELNPGESKTLTVTLKWVNGNENFGSKVNEARIIATSNEAGYEDSNKDDNSAVATEIISIKTGGQQIIEGVIIGTTAALVALVVCLIVVGVKATKSEE